MPVVAHRSIVPPGTEPPACARRPPATAPTIAGVVQDDEDVGGLGLWWIAIAVLAVIGLFSVVGWVISTVWTLIQLAVLMAIVLLVVAAVRASRR